MQSWKYMFDVKKNLCCHFNSRCERPAAQRNFLASPSPLHPSSSSFPSPFSLEFSSTSAWQGWTESSSLWHFAWCQASTNLRFATCRMWRPGAWSSSLSSNHLDSHFSALRRRSRPTCFSLLSRAHDSLQILLEVCFGGNGAGFGESSDGSSESWDHQFCLAQLDGAEASKNLSRVKFDDEEKDFYAAVADCPIHPRCQVADIRYYINKQVLGSPELVWFKQLAQLELDLPRPQGWKIPQQKVEFLARQIALWKLKLVLEDIIKLLHIHWYNTHTFCHDCIVSESYYTNLRLDKLSEISASALRPPQTACDSTEDARVKLTQIPHSGSKRVLSSVPWV